MPELEQAHISELHALAAEAGVERYRMLHRTELLDALRERGVVKAPDGDGQADERGAGVEEPPRGEPPEAGEPVTGILDVMPQRYGFLRLRGLEPADGDVYISASQIRRCELRTGDEVSGPARDPRRGERHRALIHVDAVNGAAPGDRAWTDFDELTPVPPSRRLPLEGAGDGDEALLLRAADLLAPLAFGQRVLVSAAPRSGRTTLLRGLARALARTQ